MDELDALFDALRKTRFLTLLGEIVRWKKTNKMTSSVLSLASYNADVKEIIQKAGWTGDDFHMYYIGYHKAMREELNEELEKINDK